MPGNAAHAARDVDAPVTQGDTGPLPLEPTQRSTSGPGCSTRLDTLLANLSAMGADELATQWRSLESSEPPKVPEAQLRRLIAYRAQVLHHGGLRPAAERELRRAGQQAPASATPTGTRLIREWHGRTINVQVRGEDYLWEGRAYRSLSRIAQEVTGAKWSGPRFFGLGRNG